MHLYTEVGGSQFELRLALQYDNEESRHGLANYALYLPFI